MAPSPASRTGQRSPFPGSNGGPADLPLADDAAAPGDLQEQIEDARQAEAQWQAEVAALEHEHRGALADRNWDSLPDLEGRLLKARQAHATAAGQVEGLRHAARAIAEAMARDAAEATAQRQRETALADEGRAIEAERAAAEALQSRLTDFWGCIAAAQQAFDDARQIEEQVRQHRQARNNAARIIHGGVTAVPAVAPNQTQFLRDYKPGVRELLNLQPGPL